MNKIIPDRINNKAIKLWEEHEDITNGNRIPLIYGRMDNHPVLVIGLNPAYSTLSVWSTLRATKEDCSFDQVEDAFSWNSMNNHSKRWSKREHKYTKYCYSKYFGPIMDYCRTLDYAHDSFNVIDLYFFRKTNFRNRTQIVGSIKNPTPFGRQQMELSWDLIKKSTPRVILINNKDAGRRLHYYINQSNQSAIQNDSFGYEITTDPYCEGYIKINGREIYSQCCNQMGSSTITKETIKEMASKAKATMNSKNNNR